MTFIEGSLSSIKSNQNPKQHNENWIHRSYFINPLVSKWVPIAGSCLLIHSTSVTEWRIKELCSWRIAIHFRCHILMCQANETFKHCRVRRDSLSQESFPLLLPVASNVMRTAGIGRADGEGRETGRRGTLSAWTSSGALSSARPTELLCKDKRHSDRQHRRGGY